MKSKYSKPIIIFVAVAVIVAIGMAVYNYGGLFAPKPDYSKLGYVQVDATITNVSRSGVRASLSTLLQVQYEYKGQKYSDTLRMGGYAEGQFTVGETITRWLDPAHPETLIEG